MNCAECNKEFEPQTYHHTYCSPKCNEVAKARRARNKRLQTMPHTKVCEFCGRIFRAARFDRQTCSKECSIELGASKQRKFLDIPDCIEGASRKLDKNIGYVRLYVPMHPEANTWGYVYEHRVIAEQMIGRRLEKDEIVHHKNGKRWDNRPENLEVMDKREHAKLGGQREEDKDK